MSKMKHETIFQTIEISNNITQEFNENNWKIKISEYKVLEDFQAPDSNDKMLRQLTLQMHSKPRFLTISTVNGNGKENPEKRFKFSSPNTGLENKVKYLPDRLNDEKKAQEIMEKYLKDVSEEIDNFLDNSMNKFEEDNVVEHSGHDDGDAADATVNEIITGIVDNMFL